MAKYGSKGSSTLNPQYPASQANPNSQHWKDHVNSSCLPDREFPAKKAPQVDTIKNPRPYPNGITPVTKHGTLIEDDGDGALLRLRAKSDKGSYPS